MRDQQTVTTSRLTTRGGGPRAAVDQRLRRLSEIGQLLGRDDPAEQVLPAVAGMIGRAFKLRSLVLAIGPARRVRSVVWIASGVDPHEARVARSHALRWCAYMAGDGTWSATDLAPSSVDRPRLCRAAARFVASAPHLVTFPLVVRDAGVLGALQLECAEIPVEQDVVFLGQVATLFAGMLDRQSRHAAEETHALLARMALRGELDFTSSVVDSLGEGVLAVDAHGVINFVNPAAKVMLGWTGHSNLGAPIHDVLQFGTMDGSICAPEASPLSRTLRSGAAGPGEECLFSTRTRPSFPVSLTLSPLKNEGVVTGAVVVFQDILEVRRSERTQRFLALSAAALATSLDPVETVSVVGRLPVPLLADVCFLDLVRDDGGIERTVPVVAKDLGCRRCWTVRQPPPQVAESPQAQALRTGRTLLCSDVEGTSVVGEAPQHSPEDLDLPITSMVVVPLMARGRVLGTETFAMAGSGRRLTAADLADLEEVAARAAVAIENATLYRREQLATRARDEILAVVSHDLRNPLAVVIGGAALLGELPASDDRRHRTIHAIQRAAQRMRRLIADLLDASSIDGGRLSIEITREPADALVREALDIAAESLPGGRRLSFRVASSAGPDALVVCDHDRILQVFSNLIGNATKFTPDGKSIRVGARRDGDDVVFFVADDGPGIAPQHLPHVFERFWQLHRTSGPRSGLGLGLSISRGIVDTHGGRIWVESEEGVGTTFFFSLHAVLTGSRSP